MRRSGIYIVIVNGVPAYVGASVDLDRRIKNHLRRCHESIVDKTVGRNDRILREYCRDNACSAEDVDAIVIEECDQDSVGAREKYWVPRIRAMHPGILNTTDGGNGNLTGNPINPWTDEQLELLGAMRDKEVASLIGRSTDAVKTKRIRRGIPSYRTMISNLIKDVTEDLTPSEMADKFGVPYHIAYDAMVENGMDTRKSRRQI